MSGIFPNFFLFSLTPLPSRFTPLYPRFAPLWFSWSLVCYYTYIYFFLSLPFTLLSFFLVFPSSHPHTFTFTLTPTLTLTLSRPLSLHSPLCSVRGPLFFLFL